MKTAPAHKVMLFGVPIDNLTLSETLDRIEEMIRNGATHQHVVVNVDKIVKLQTDPELRKAVLSCDLISADGQPIIWASRILQQPIKERVTGVDLFGSLVERCAQRGHRLFFLGARQEVVERVVNILQVKHPSLQIAGWRNGYWQPDEERDVVDAIRRARPEILFVAMSSPKKELFLATWKQELSVPFVMGVGGTFDVVAGRVKRAPRWMQKWGLEWLFRLAQEPRRMWRRYLVEDMAFFRLVWREWRTAQRSRN
ncbi:MAG TPA: WecB/TagA/CpsF family glycosyltransferase [Verrucomicrobiae bacterium]|nr:WecB/TagA/CpsF family glycosyltransferase [Verrucomicrobiae bacterium]